MPSSFIVVCPQTVVNQFVQKPPIEAVKNNDCIALAMTCERDCLANDRLAKTDSPTWKWICQDCCMSAAQKAQ